MKLYKYLPLPYAERMLCRGEILFRSLSYFRDIENDGVRQDDLEGILFSYFMNEATPPKTRRIIIAYDCDGN